MRDKETNDMIGGLLKILSKNSKHSKVTYGNGIWYYKFSHEKMTIEPSMFKVIFTGDYVVDDFDKIKVFDNFDTMKSYVIGLLKSDDIKKRISIYKKHLI
jgi:hypothetical protein